MIILSSSHSLLQASIQTKPQQQSITGRTSWNASSKQRLALPARNACGASAWGKRTSYFCVSSSVKGCFRVAFFIEYANQG